MAIDAFVPFAVIGSDGSTLGNDFINWSQQGADDFVSSFGPSPLTGGWGNKELQTGFDGASIILGGASLLNPRSASILDDLVPTPNRGSPNPGTLAGATDGEMVGQPQWNITLDVDKLDDADALTPSRGTPRNEPLWITFDGETPVDINSNGNLDRIHAEVGVRPYI